MPAHHDVRASDVLAPRLHATFAAAADRGPADFAELLLVPGVGARTVRALAMVAEVVHGAPYRFTDPARFSFAHGGKDRHPFPVPLKVYDETIAVMKAAVQKAKLGQDDRLAALQRLDDEARRVERRAAGPPCQDVIAEERRLSHSFRRPQRVRLGAGAGGARSRAEAETCLQSRIVRLNDSEYRRPRGRANGSIQSAIQSGLAPVRASGRHAASIIS